jgi:hypothetical protein
MPAFPTSPKRTRVEILFQAVAPATADTLLSMIKVTDGVAAGGATSIAVAASRTLRLTSVEFSLRAGAAAAAFGTLTLRSNPSGATVIGSQSIGAFDVGNTEATVGAARAIVVPLNDGMEFSGAQTLGCSLAAQAVTNVIAICLRGYEYSNLPPQLQ